MCCPCVTPAILFHITALAIMQDFRKKNQLFYFCIPYILIEVYGPPIFLLFLSYVNITKIHKFKKAAIKNGYFEIVCCQKLISHWLTYM